MSRVSLRGMRSMGLETRVYAEPDREALQVAADELGAFLGRTAVVDWSLG